MQSDLTGTSRLIEWAVATSTASGESQSGDRHIVLPFAGGVLVAVMDGLGHGPGAAAAVGIAADTLTRHAGESV
jgi:negative regulator of sigma-B (phosphoserine phosphatase)